MFEEMMKKTEDVYRGERKYISDESCSSD